MSDRALAIGLGISLAGLAAAVFAMGYLAGMSSLRRKILETRKARGRIVHGDATAEVWDAARPRRGA